MNRAHEIPSSGCPVGCTHQHGLDTATHALRLAIDADPALRAQVASLHSRDQRAFADALQNLLGVAGVNYYMLASFYGIGLWLMTVPELSRHSGLAPTTIRTQIERGRIVAQKMGRDYLVRWEDMAAYLATRDRRGKYRADVHA